MSFIKSNKINIYNGARKGVISEMKLSIKKRKNYCSCTVVFLVVEI
jgi:hypothetical protein